MASRICVLKVIVKKLVPGVVIVHQRLVSRNDGGVVALDLRVVDEAGSLKSLDVLPQRGYSVGLLLLLPIQRAVSGGLAREDFVPIDDALPVEGLRLQLLQSEVLGRIDFTLLVPSDEIQKALGGIVVKYEDLAVRAELDVVFHRIHALLERALGRIQGVFHIYPVAVARASGPARQATVAAMAQEVSGS